MWRSARAGRSVAWHAASCQQTWCQRWAARAPCVASTKLSRKPLLPTIVEHSPRRRARGAVMLERRVRPTLHAFCERTIGSDIRLRSTGSCWFLLCCPYYTVGLCDVSKCNTLADSCLGEVGRGPGGSGAARGCGAGASRPRRGQLAEGEGPSGVSVCVVPPWDSLTSTRERAALAEPLVVGETRSPTLMWSPMPPAVLAVTADGTCQLRCACGSFGRYADHANR